MSRKEKIKKEIDLSKLPRKYGKGSNINKLVIDWKNSIGIKVNGVYDNMEFEVIIKKYTSKGQRLDILYNNKEFNISTSVFCNCMFGKILGIITNKFKIEVGTRFKDDKRDLTIIDREYREDEKGQNWKWYKYHCNICDWDEGWIVESSLIGTNNTGCSCCCGRTIVEGINDIPTTAPWMVQYFQGGYDEAKKYTKWGSGNLNNPKGYIKPICPDCGRVKDKIISIGGIYSNHSIGCSCGDGYSYPNKFAFKLFEELKIEFISEYSPDWIKPRRYDFYIPSMNLIIEMDGGLGHGKYKHSKSKVSKEESKAIDNYKDEQAKIHGIEVVRIDCDLSDLIFIKGNIIKSRLNELFDLSEINWNKIDEFSLNNRVRTVCDYWNSGIHDTIKISKIMKIDRQIVWKYLKKGVVKNWCDYKPIKKETKSKNKLKSNNIKSNKKCKSLEIFKDNVSLGIFQSSAELERQSEKLFGVKLNNRNISAVCRGEKKTYKGFIFKYI